MRAAAPTKPGVTPRLAAIRAGLHPRPSISPTRGAIASAFARNRSHHSRSGARPRETSRPRTRSLLRHRTTVASDTPCSEAMASFDLLQSISCTGMDGRHGRGRRGDGGTGTPRRSSSLRFIATYA